jgi:PUA-domain protein
LSRSNDVKYEVESLEVDVHLPAKRYLKDKEAKLLLREFIQRYPSSEKFLKSYNLFEEESIDGNVVYFLDGRPLILRVKSRLLPSLKFDEVINLLPRVVVDMGAVAHLANGANLMRPGIREIRGDFAKGELLLMVDEKFGKHIALGLAEADSSVLRSVDKGKVVMNVHYVGDEFWASFTGDS